MACRSKPYVCEVFVNGFRTENYVKETGLLKTNVIIWIINLLVIIVILENIFRFEESRLTFYLSLLKMSAWLGMATLF